MEARRNGEKAEQRHDLFSGLLDAAQDESGGEAAISDEELIGGFDGRGRLAFLKSVLPVLLGNMFIFLFAGHEVRTLFSRGVVIK